MVSHRATAPSSILFPTICEAIGNDRAISLRDLDSTNGLATVIASNQLPFFIPRSTRGTSFISTLIYRKRLDPFDDKAQAPSFRTGCTEGAGGQGRFGM